MTQSASVSVVIIEDHEMLLESLTVALEQEDDIEVADTATTLHDGLAQVRRHSPDVVLIDVRLPDGDGIDGIGRIHTVRPDLPVVVMTARATPDVVGRAAGARCAGFLHKTKSVDDLAFTVRGAAAGRVVMSADMMSGLTGHLDKPPADALSEREFEVLLHVARGRDTDEIADKLVLSAHTVRNHIRHVLAKLDVHSKLEAVTEALIRGLLEIDDLR